MKKQFISLLSIISFSFAFAQVGINTETPRATLDVTAKVTDGTTAEGLIAPRLTGNEIQSKDAQYGPNQTGTIVYATSAVSTPAGTKTTNITAPGYYYFDGTIWTKLGSGTTTEPWFLQGSTTQATLNTQNIYQTGAVAIGKMNGTPGVPLDVKGAALFGTSHTSTVGFNSAAFGTLNTVAGPLAFALGAQNIIDANSSTSIAWGSGNKITLSPSYSLATAWGYLNVITGNALGSTAFGQYNTITGSLATTFGNTNNAIGNNSTVFGISNTTASYNEVGFGQYNAIKTGNAASYVLTDPLLQIGNGTASTAANALTILKNGNTGIGISGTEAAAKPTERLDIGSGNVRIRDINTTTGAVTDKIVVADTNGILKTVSQATMSIRSFAGTALNTDYTILATGNITLPAPSGNSGKVYNIIYKSGSVNVTNSFVLGGSVISSYGLNATPGGQGITVQSDGTDWYIISKF